MNSSLLRGGPYQVLDEPTCRVFEAVLGGGGAPRACVVGQEDARHRPERGARGGSKKKGGSDRKRANRDKHRVVRLQ